jgi:cytochrome P450
VTTAAAARQTGGVGTGRLRTGTRVASPVSAPARPAPVYHGTPGLGSLAHFRDDLLGTLLRAGELGPVVRFRMPPGVQIRSYGVFSPEGAARMLTGSPEGYRKDSRPYEETSAFFGNGLLTSQDQRWHRQRRFVAPLFTPRRLEDEYLPVLVEEAARMQERWREGPDSTADVHALSVAYTLRAIGRVLFGADLDDVLPRLGPVFARANAYLSARVATASLVPRSWPTRTNRSGRAARRDLYAIADGLIERRRANPGDSEDLLGRLLRARDPQTRQPLNADEVRDQALIFLLAGHETTATALAFSLQLLARNPQVQRRTQQELDGVGPSEGRPGDLVRGTPYLQQVMKEALRLYPPAFAVSRYTATGDVVCGTEIPPRSNVFVGTFAMHRAPDVWPEPTRFDPDRFAPAEVARRHRLAWLPFGAGAHVCIGAQLATAELTVALAQLLRTNRVVCAETDAAVPPIASGLVLRPSAPMPLRLMPRAQQPVPATVPGALR